MKHSETVAAIFEALAAAQAEYVAVPKSKTAKVKGTSKNGKDYDFSYKYADLADILSMALPRLSKQGIALAQPHVLVDGKLRVCTYLLHKSGEWMQSDGIEVSEASPDPQQMGIESTYFRRYDLASLIGVAPDEDTDAQQAGDRTRKPSENISKPSGASTANPTTQPSTQRPAASPAAKAGQAGVLRFIPPNGLTAVIARVKEIEGFPARAATAELPAMKAVRARVIVTLAGEHNGVSEASCFDTKLWPALRESVGLECHFQIAEKDSNGKHYINIEDIIYVDGEEYSNGVPV
jgi:hypothetical protein